MEQPSTSGLPDRDDDDLMYQPKHRAATAVGVSHQNENGPCPLIAIINVLTLKGLIKLPQTLDIVTVEQLMEHLGDCILSSIPKDIPESAQLNYEQNMHDAIAILPKLQTGLDVNVRFTGVKDFEYTPECIVFDLLRIPLYHGWLLDPECPEILAAVGNCSYNQLVERIIINKSSTKPELVTEALLAEAFLERTASQLTYHGLCELNSTLIEDELCVLFRNNHFITLHKRKDRLYQLVTDQGFLNEPDVVWESLINVEGDGQFADSDFVVNPPKPRCLTTEQQIDRDEELAKQLQEEEHHRALSRPPARSASGSAQDAVESTVRQRQNNSSPPSKKDDKQGHCRLSRIEITLGNLTSTWDSTGLAKSSLLYRLFVRDGGQGFPFLVGSLQSSRMPKKKTG
ncbi:hypothetical protein HPB49_004069 [Dermacentor silvarum]|uniref:Uncharacterized protein n=1 Tax=Dermacentor silvarum TaxID=543639 RepID=A0ACB8DIE5_DERSI|nr:hypothetical protein HPB49_004069 [Dermacentor silvarum]